jgi:hypothetical protein
LSTGLSAPSQEFLTIPLGHIGKRLSGDGEQSIYLDPGVRQWFVTCSLIRRAASKIGSCTA